MADEEYYHPDYLDYMQKKFKTTLANPGVSNEVCSKYDIKRTFYLVGRY
jgi:hypothetical protein